MAIVAVRLIGGLGNQLFQYAAGRRLANARGVPLVLDVSSFDTYTLHRFSLLPFALQCRFASAGERAAIRATSEERRMYQALLAIRRIVGGAPRLTGYREPAFNFDSTVLDLPPNVYLDGYWQSERYFSDISSLLHRELTIRTPQRGRDASIGERILATQSVSVHVRRGDYVQNAATNRAHGTSPPEYYERALRHLRDALGDIEVFVFSDDTSWCKQHLDFGCPTTYVDHNSADTNFEDLRLMSQCKHNVTANSSFSWWGAWLNKNPRKLVIAPRRWFNEHSVDTRDLCPETWTLL